MNTLETIYKKEYKYLFDMLTQYWLMIGTNRSLFYKTINMIFPKSFLTDQLPDLYINISKRKKIYYGRIDEFKKRTNLYSRLPEHNVTKYNQKLLKFSIQRMESFRRVGCSQIQDIIIYYISLEDILHDMFLTYITKSGKHIDQIELGVQKAMFHLL